MLLIINSGKATIFKMIRFESQDVQNKFCADNSWPVWQPMAAAAAAAAAESVSNCCRIKTDKCWNMLC